MRKYLLGGIAAGAIGMLALAPLAAHADVYIGLQYDSSTPTQVATGATSASYSSTTGYESFSASAASGAVGTFPYLLSSQASATFDSSTTNGTNMTIWITETDITDPSAITDALTSSFTSGTVPGAFTLAEHTYYNPDNTTFYSNALVPIDYVDFGSAGSQSKSAMVTFPAAKFSLTEQYIVEPHTSSLPCGSTDACSLSGSMGTRVPEPGSLALLATALAVFGIAGWGFERRRAV